MVRDTIEGKSPVATKRRFLRFGLSALVLFIGLCAVVLALVTQLKHVGLVASCFVSGSAAGWWFQRQRLMAASLTALLVFVVTYLASWVHLGYTNKMDQSASIMNEMHFQDISAALSRYAETNGGAPDSLSDLADLGDHNLVLDPSGQPVDYWHHPFYYQRNSNGFELASLGRDGKIGGLGLDADLFYDETSTRASARLPWSQFLFETPASRSVFMVALVSGLVAGSIWLQTLKDQQVTTRRLIAGVVVTTISAVVVAVFLAAFHVAVSQSGH